MGIREIFVWLFFFVGLYGKFVGFGILKLTANLEDAMLFLQTIWRHYYSLQVSNVNLYLQRDNKN